MAKSNIPNAPSAYVPVIQLNNTLYLEDGVLKPQTLNVPCGEHTHIDNPYYWAVPIKDSGTFRTVEFIPQTDVYGNAVDQPTFDSFVVQRVRDKASRYTWWVIIDADASPPVDFTDVCATCCGEEALTLSGTVPVVAPCQDVCDAVNDDGNYFVTFGAPALAGGENYSVHGSFDNEELPAFTSTSLDDLINDLNSNYGTIGSPAVDITWTRDGSVIIGTFQNGDGEGSSICVLIEAV